MRHLSNEITSTNVVFCIFRPLLSHPFIRIPLDTCSIPQPAIQCMHPLMTCHNLLFADVCSRNITPFRPVMYIQSVVHAIENFNSAIIWLLFVPEKNIPATTHVRTFRCAVLCPWRRIIKTFYSKYIMYVNTSVPVNLFAATYSETASLPAATCQKNKALVWTNAAQSFHV